MVAVGDFDVKQVETLIRRQFADAKARRGEQPDPTLGKVVPAGGPLAGYHYEADASAVTVKLSNIVPANVQSDSIAGRRRDLIRGLTTAMLNQRFEKLSTAKDAPFQGAGAGFEAMFDVADDSSFTAVCQPKQWQAALASLDQELRRAIDFGFSDGELAQARSMALASFKSEANQAETRQAAALADEIVATLANRRVFTHPSDDLTLFTRLLSDVNKDECQALLRTTWQPQALRIWLHGNVQLSGDASQQVLAAYRAAEATAVQKSQEEQVGQLKLADLGPAGTIVRRQQIKDLDFVEATLSNNVRVNVKRTALEKNHVRVVVRFGSGLLEMPADKPGLGLLTMATFIRGGLQSQSLSQMQQSLSDKEVGVVFNVADDAFQLSGGCSPALLELQLQLCAAYLTAPGYREEARDQFLAGAESFYAQLEHTPEGVLSNGAFAFLRGDDTRFKFPTRQELGKLTMGDVKAWLAEPLRSGYMEVVIVGDVDPDQALQLTAKTLGALPPRAAAKPEFATASKLQFPTAPRQKDFQFQSPAPRAVVMVCWPTVGSRASAIIRRLEVLRTVLNDRLWTKIRQELGATYTPETVQYSADAYPDYGYLAALLIVDPKQVAEIGPLAAKIGAELATRPITSDELDRARKPILASYDSLDNGYWTGLLIDCQANPVCLDQARIAKADYAAITTAELQALAKQYLAAGKATIINVAPIK